MAEHPPQWLSSVTDDSIKRRWGVSTLLRGKTYAAAGKVISYSFGPRGAISASVQDLGPKVYWTKLNHTSSGLESTCDCPSGGDCKHAVAVLLTLREELGTPQSPDWEQVLSGLLPASDGLVDEQLGLEFSLISQNDSTDIRIRPLFSVRGGWRRLPSSWGEFLSPWNERRCQARQEEVMKGLVTAAGLSSSHSSMVYLRAAAIGPLLWPLLRRCDEVGIPLIPGEDLRSVSLHPTAVRLWLDALADTEGIQLVGSGDIGPLPPGGRRFLIGQPAHGIAELVGGALTLAPLAGIVPEAMTSLVTSDAPLRIPASEAARFRTIYLPALSNHLPVQSSDGSCPPPAPAEPRLTLTVAGTQGHEVRLRWAIRYFSEEDSVEVGLGRESSGVFRSHIAEEKLESAVVTLLAGYPELVTPDGLREEAALSGTSAARFITELLPILVDHGVSVIRSPELPNYVRIDEAPVIILGAEDTADRDWFNLKVRVQVAGHDVDFEQLFRAMAAGDDALVLDNGTWFALDHPELHQLRHLIEEAKALTDVGPTGEIRVSSYHTGLWEELVCLGVTDQVSNRWRQRVAALGELEHPEQALATPPGLQARLRPYQVTGFSWLATLWDAELGGVLADDMGLGKTLQTLAVIERARERGDLDQTSVLVVAPASVVGAWVAEAEKFAPQLRVVAIQAGAKKRGNTLATAVAGAHLVVTSYTLLRLEAKDFQQIAWRGLVLDEAQFIKNHRSVTYRAVRALNTNFTLAITGTPLENSLTDMWSMVSLAAPGLFPKPETFAELYRKPIETQGDSVALARLRQRLRPFMLRRTKARVVTELPEKVEQILQLELSPAHRRRYDRYLTRERSRVLGMLDDMEHNRIAIFRALTMLRQLALDPRLIDDSSPVVPSAKIQALTEQLRELAQEGHRALVFSSFTGFLTLVKQALDEEGIDYIYLDGRTRNRAQRIAEFREGQAPAFLISLKAGGFGLTLTEADYVFMLDPWWNPAAENQAIDRAHRIGQTRAVNVYKMVATDTIEDKVVALQHRKRALFDSVMETGEFRSGTITAEDIRGLLG